MVMQQIVSDTMHYVQMVPPSRWAGGKSVKQFHDFMHARFVTVLYVYPNWEFEFL